MLPDDSFFKIKTLITISFILVFQLLYSQNTTIDSLETALKNHKAKDTTRVNILNHLAFHHYRNNPPEATTYVEEALKLAYEIKSEKSIAQSLYIKGFVYMEQANFEVAINNLNNALKHYTSLKDLKGIEKCKNVFGILYSYKGDFKLSLKSYEEGKEIAEKLDDKNSVDKYLYNIGNVYLNTGAYQKAKDNFKEALNINIKEKDSLGMFSNLNSIADVYYEQGNYPLSIKYHNQSLYIVKKIKDSIGIFRSYNNIGNVYRAQRLNDKALLYYNQALAIKAASFNIKNITALKNNIAGIFYDEKDYKSAETYYLESIALSKKIDDKMNLTTAINGLGFIYLDTKKYDKALECFKEALEINALDYTSLNLLDSYQGLAETYFDSKNYELALTNAIKLVKLAKENNVLSHKKNAYNLLYKIYKIKGDYKKAFENHEQYKIVSDSLLNEDNIKKIAEIEYEYKYKSELENAAKRENKLTKTVETTTQDLEKSQRNLLLGIITFLVVAMVLGSIIFYLKLRNSKAKTQNIITEQKLLRTQMTPHFIFNSLSVLQGMILNKEESKSVSYLSKFSKLLRITLENSRDKTVLLSHELEAVENYLSLQNIENEKIAFQLHVDKAIETNIIKVPPMLIQPFVENAIEHAFKNQKDNCVIEIKLTLVDTKLICVILDNGMGIDSSERNSNQNKKSLATKITKERLDYLSKDFKMDASIAIEDRTQYNEQGTQVTIQMPYSTTES
jgi:tetratricopeptide (TPR) repeat protein